jgi:hypothetical protein
MRGKEFTCGEGGIAALRGGDPGVGGFNMLVIKYLVCLWVMTPGFYDKTVR